MKYVSKTIIIQGINQSDLQKQLTPFCEDGWIITNTIATAFDTDIVVSMVKIISE